MYITFILLKLLNRQSDKNETFKAECIFHKRMSETAYQTEDWNIKWFISYYKILAAH